MASYQLRSSFPEYPYRGLDLGRDSLFVKVFLFIVFAPLVIFFTAIIGAYIYGVYGKSGISLDLLLPAGALSIMISLMLVTLRRPLPERILFDREAQQLIILDQPQSSLMGAPRLAYSAIRNFDVVRFVTQSNNRSSVSWRVSLIKRDLSVWPLMTYKTQEEALKKMEELIKAMEFSSNDPGEAQTGEGDQRFSGWTLHSAPELDLAVDSAHFKRFQVDRGVTQSTIKWSRARSPRRRLGVHLFLFGCLCIIIGGILAGGQALIAAAIFTLIGGVVWRVVSIFNPEGSIEISGEEVKLERKRLFFGGVYEAQCSSESLASIGFNIDQPHCLLLMTHEQKSRLDGLLDKQGSPDLNGAIGLFNLMREVVRVDSSGLTSSETLQLEMLIEQEFEHHNDHSLL